MFAVTTMFTSLAIGITATAMFASLAEIRTHSFLIKEGDFCATNITYSKHNNGNIYLRDLRVALRDFLEALREALRPLREAEAFLVLPKSLNWPFLAL